MKNQIITKNLAFASLCLFVLSACSRPEGEMTRAQFSIANPLTSQKEIALSGKTLGHIVLNITASDLREPIIYNWDAHDGDITQTAPSSIQLDVPSGPARLIQALVVYKDSDTGSMLFYYGDAKQDFYSTSESVALSVASLGAGDVVSGRVSGRYLSGGLAEYTGPLLMKYTPPGKPSLTITRNHILSGWFNVFMLEGSSLAKFSYELENGTMLWGRAVNLSDPEFTPSSSVMKVDLPVRWRKQNQPSNSFSWEFEEAQVYAYGFFGPGVGSQSICRQDSYSADGSTLPTLPNYSVYTTTKPADNSSPAAMPGSLLTLSALPSVTDLLSISTPYSGFRVKGGLPNTDSTCASAVDNVGKIYLNDLYSILINGNGNDNSSAHFAPFTRSVNGGPVSIASSGTDYVMSGGLLPGMSSLLVDRMIIYKKVSSENINFQDDEVPCRMLAAGGFGFQKVNEYALTASNFSGVSLGITAADKATAGVGPNIAVCVAKGTLLYDIGFVLGKDHFN